MSNPGREQIIPGKMLKSIQIISLSITVSWTLNQSQMLVFRASKLPSWLNDFIIILAWVDIKGYTSLESFYDIEYILDDI